MNLQGGELLKGIPGKNDKYEERYRSAKDWNLVKEGEIYLFYHSIKYTWGFKRR